MTFAEHAEAWTKEKGEEVPQRNTTEWLEMYSKWHSFAFAGWGIKDEDENPNANVTVLKAE